MTGKTSAAMTEPVMLPSPPRTSMIRISMDLSNPIWLGVGAMYWEVVAEERSSCPGKEGTDSEEHLELCAVYPLGIQRRSHLPALRCKPGRNRN